MYSSVLRSNLLQIILMFDLDAAVCCSVDLLVRVHAAVGCMYGTREAPHTVYTVRSTVVIGLNTGLKLNLLQGSDKFTAC